MRKVVVQQFVTLDRFAAGPNGELDFVTETGGAADPTSGPFVAPFPGCRSGRAQRVGRRGLDQAGRGARQILVGGDEDVRL